MNSFTAPEIIVTACGILIGLYIPPSQTSTTIGLDQIVRTVNEPDGPVRLCASVMASTSSNYEINITVIYQDRSATGRIAMSSIHDVDNNVNWTDNSVL